MAKTQIVVQKMAVLALKGANKVNLDVTRMIADGSVDEGLALLTFSFQPQVEAKVKIVDDEVDPGTIQVIFKFRLYHKNDLVWTGFCSEILMKKNTKIQVSPTVLIDLSAKRRKRDMVGTWEMRFDLGVVDLHEFRQLDDLEASTFMDSLKFEYVGDVLWGVEKTVKAGSLNENGQFNKPVNSYSNKTYNLKDI